MKNDDDGNYWTNTECSTGWCDEEVTKIRICNLIYFDKYLLSTYYVYSIVLKLYQDMVPKFEFVFDSIEEIFKNKFPEPHISFSDSKYLELGLEISNV